MENTPVKAEIKKIVKEIRKREIVDHFDIPEAVSYTHLTLPTIYSV